MYGGLSRIEYDECFAKLFGIDSPLRRRAGKVRSWRRRLRDMLGRAHRVADQATGAYQ